MPLPFLIPALFAAGSVAANSIGARKQDRALGSALGAERIRQKQLDEEAFAINEQARQRYEGGQESADAEASKLAEVFRNATQAPPTEAPVALAPSSSNIVNNATAASNAATSARSDARAGQMGNLRGFADMFSGVQTEQARDFGQLGLLGGFKRGSQGVLPTELEAAQQKGAGFRTLADFLNLGAGATLNSALLPKTGAS